MLEVSEHSKATSKRQAKTLLSVELASAIPRMMTGCPAPHDLGVAHQHPSVPRPPVGSGGGYPKPNLFHLLLQGVQGVSPGQQLLQAAQLPLLLLAVLLLLLPLLLQRSDLGFVAADGVWQGRKAEERRVSARGSPALTHWARQFTTVTTLRRWACGEMALDSVSLSASVSSAAKWGH